MSQQNEAPRMTAAELLTSIESNGSVETEQYLFTADPAEWTIVVWEKVTQKMVAYSSTKADYAVSLVEFVQDYG